MSVGNYDGDLEMIQNAFSRKESKLMVYVNHTDAERVSFLWNENQIWCIKKGLEVTEKIIGHLLKCNKMEANLPKKNQ